MTKIRIENAQYLVTVDENDTILTNATVVIDNGVITEITTEDGDPTAKAPDGAEREATEGRERKATDEERPEAERESSRRPLAGSGGGSHALRGRAGVRAAGERADGLRPTDDSRSAAGDPTSDQNAEIVIDATGKLVLPGLVNLHTHLPMTLLRGLAENLDLDGFLQHLWAAEAAVMDEETVKLGATLGALESLLAGCTTQLDMYFHHEATHRGAVAAGSRHVIGPVFFGGPGPTASPACAPGRRSSTRSAARESRSARCRTPRTPAHPTTSPRSSRRFARCSPPATARGC